MRLNASSSKAREAVVLLVVDVDEMDSVAGEKVEVNEPLAEWMHVEAKKRNVRMHNKLRGTHNIRLLGSG